MNTTPARCIAVYDDRRLLGFVVARDERFLAVTAAGDEVGTFPSQEIAVAALR